MTILFDHRDPALLNDPYPVYRRLRAAEPVHWCAPLRAWLLTRWDDVRDAQRDLRFSADRANPFADHMAARDRPEAERMGRLLAKWVVFSDPPRHTVLRRLMVDTFTPRAIEALRPRITAIVDGLLDGLAGRETVDLIGDFAYPLPATVIAHILGVPDADVDRFRDWSDDLAGVVGTAPTESGRFERGAQALFALGDYFRGIVAERRRRGDGGALIDRLIQAHDEDGSLDVEELIQQCVILLFAGHETTTNLIGNGMILLMRHPDELARLRAEPALMGSAVEEILRFESPAHAVLRIAAEDMTIRGTRIAKGDRVYLMLAAANRDPEQFPDPDRFDIARSPNRHLSFGYGLHFCIGAGLARVEGEIALTRLLARYPAFRLAAERVDWEPSLVLRGVPALPLALKPAA